MTRYSVQLTERAKADLQRLDRTASRRIVRRIQWLGDNFESVVLRPLTGELAGSFKLRVGDYRVIYRVVHGPRLLVVQMIGHRSDVYDS